MRKKQYRLERTHLNSLLKLLREEGYQTYGPVRGELAMEWAPLTDVGELPRGWTSAHGPAHYRLENRGGESLFGYRNGPESLKKFLHPPRARIMKAERNGGAFRILEDRPAAAKRAFLGVKPCDVAAVAALDRVLLNDRYSDDIYQANRAGLFLIAVHCTECAETCFCASSKAGPQAKTGFDIALHERLDGAMPEYFAECGTAAGAALLEKTGAPPAPPEWARELADACALAAGAQQRKVDFSSAAAVVERNYDSPRWDDIARRCMACGNCTQACPTCFCVNFEEHSSLDLQTAERHRVWDSCFTQNFTYIHGGSVRLSTKSRYRHWLGHKLARWQQQFGSPGCVGCGRCITWCPAGIDITAEFEWLKAGAPAAI
ncbi:MAG: 4Fe-4S dicluster domain-containing protein [Acidobacteria bacterium]|nr:4Fe-4S dicluster domain-containing protein [Acidobacteriota bacterium]